MGSRGWQSWAVNSQPQVASDLLESRAPVCRKGVTKVATAEESTNKVWTNAA